VSKQPPGSGRKFITGGRAGRSPGRDKLVGTKPDKQGTRPLPVRPWSLPFPGRGKHYPPDVTDKHGR
jgi:hypothetical protein